MPVLVYSPATISLYKAKTGLRMLKMKVASSLKTLKSRDRNCQVVRRRGRLYVINKKNPRMKARQG